MAFFPTYKDNWTRTPNVFFDVILKTPGISANEIKIIGYLIRNTLGYNRDAKWTCVTRKDLIEKAGVSNGNITNALKKCEENEWILIYEEGEGTKKKRYIFLNDDRNSRIVVGLKKGFFKIEDLEYLNEAGIDRLLEKYGLMDENMHSSTESVQENVCSSTESVQATYTDSVEVAYTESVQVTYTESVQVNSPQTQASQEIAATLNTNIKDNNKDNVKRQQLTQFVVVVRNKIEEYFGQKLTDKHVKHLIDLAEIEEVDLMEMVENTYQYYQAMNETCQNAFGAIKHAILYGGWTISEKPKKYDGLPKAVAMQLAQEQQLDQQHARSTLTDEELAERRARIQAKLKHMDETLASRLLQEQQPVG